MLLIYVLIQKATFKTSRILLNKKIIHIINYIEIWLMIAWKMNMLLLNVNKKAC